MLWRQFACPAQQAFGELQFFCECPNILIVNACANENKTPILALVGQYLRCSQQAFHVLCSLVEATDVEECLYFGVLRVSRSLSEYLRVIEEIIDNVVDFSCVGIGESARPHGFCQSVAHAQQHICFANQLRIERSLDCRHLHELSVLRQITAPMLDDYIGDIIPPFEPSCQHALLLNDIQLHYIRQSPFALQFQPLMPCVTPALRIDYPHIYPLCAHSIYMLLHEQSLHRIARRRIPRCEIEYFQLN